MLYSLKDVTPPWWEMIWTRILNNNLVFKPLSLLIDVLGAKEVLSKERKHTERNKICRKN